MSEHTWLSQAADVLARHGYSSTGLDYIGAGAQSLCYGTGDVAVLLSRAGVDEQVPDLTGHVLPGSSELITSNSYAVLQWVTGRAAAAGVRTPRILAVGQLPRPYAIIERGPRHTGFRPCPIRGAGCWLVRQVGRRDPDDPFGRDNWIRDVRP